MIQKVLNVGTSAAVTIPKRSLKELGLKIGDSVTVTLNPTTRRVYIEPATSVDKETIAWARGFVEKHHSALKALAKKRITRCA